MLGEQMRTISILPLGLLLFLPSQGQLHPRVVDQPGIEYGAPMSVGLGQARTYAIFEEGATRAPIELGIELDSLALEGLPASGEMLEVALPLPAEVVMPFQYVVLNWNPTGHIPEEVYGVPHFDLHFYLTPRAEVEAILPSDPNFAAQANRLPSGDEVPPFYILPVAPGEEPVSLAEPRMGVHWVDARSPELQELMGNAAGHRPFTTTFIYGSWNGRVTFLEPMITRAYLLTHPDVTLPISQPAAVPEPGWYPGAYRISYDADARKYRIGLIDLTRRD